MERASTITFEDGAIAEEEGVRFGSMNPDALPSNSGNGNASK